MLHVLMEHADREGVPVIWRPLPESTGGGMCVWIGGDPVIYVDPTLPRLVLIEVLAHELAHAHRGHLPRAGSRLFAPLIAREERACDDLAAAMLVDLNWLEDAMVLADNDDITITAHDVAAEAGVTLAVAERAMTLLQRRGAA